MKKMTMNCTAKAAQLALVEIENICNGVGRYSLSSRLEIVKKHFDSLYKK